MCILYNNYYRAAPTLPVVVCSTAKMLLADWGLFGAVRAPRPFRLPEAVVVSGVDRERSWKPRQQGEPPYGVGGDVSAAAAAGGLMCRRTVAIALRSRTGSQNNLNVKRIASRIVWDTIGERYYSYPVGWFTFSRIRIIYSVHILI